MLRLVLVIQVVTFMWLGVIFWQQGDWRLGVSQLMLAAVQGIVYSGSMV